MSYQITVNLKDQESKFPTFAEALQELLSKIRDNTAKGLSPNMERFFQINYITSPIEVDGKEYKSSLTFNDVVALGIATGLLQGGELEDWRGWNPKRVEAMERVIQLAFTGKLLENSVTQNEEERFFLITHGIIPMVVVFPV